MQILNQLFSFINNINFDNPMPAKENGDGLPDEVTTLMLNYLSPLDWMINCELVCRKWRRLTNTGSLWKNWEKQIKMEFKFNGLIKLIEFKFNPNQPIPLETRKEICSLYERFPSSREKLYVFLRKVCSIKKIMALTVCVKYKSQRNEDAFLTAYFMKYFQKDANKAPKNFKQAEKKFMRSLEICLSLSDVNSISQSFFEIRGQQEADFGLDPKVIKNKTLRTLNICEEEDGKVHCIFCQFHFLPKNEVKSILEVMMKALKQ